MGEEDEEEHCETGLDRAARQGRGRDAAARGAAGRGAPHGGAACSEAPIGATCLFRSRILPRTVSASRGLCFPSGELSAPF